MGKGVNYSDEQRSCLKNCGNKIVNYTKVAKSVGFPVSWSFFIFNLDILISLNISMWYFQYTNHEQSTQIS